MMTKSQKSLLFKFIPPPTPNMTGLKLQKRQYQAKQSQIHAFFFIRKLVVLLVQDFLKNSTNF